MAEAATGTWTHPTGSGGKNFSDGTAWFSGTPPTSGDTIGSPTAYGNLTLNNSVGDSTRTVTVAGVDVAIASNSWSWLSQLSGGPNNLVVTGNFKFDSSGTGKLSVRSAGSSPGSGGTLNTSIGGTLSVLGGTLEFGNTSNSINQLTVTGQTTVSAGTLNFFGNTVSLNGGLQVNGGTVTVYNAVSGSGGISASNLSGTGGTITATTLAGSTATLTINGTTGSTSYAGELTDGSGQLSVSKTGDSTQILTGTNTYTGATSVTAGTLLVNGSLGNTAVTVGTNGRLGGGGSIAGAVTVNGTLTPGDGVGTLTLSNGLILGSASSTIFELASAVSFDRIITTALTLDGTITLSLLGGYNPTAGTTFDLFDFTSINASGFDLGTDFLLPSLAPGLAWDTSSFLTTGSISVVAAVPEPTSAMLMGLGLPVLLFLSRRRFHAAA